MLILTQYCLQSLIVFRIFCTFLHFPFFSPRVKITRYLIYKSTADLSFSLLLVLLLHPSSIYTHYRLCLFLLPLFPHISGGRQNDLLLLFRRNRKRKSDLYFSLFLLPRCCLRHRAASVRTHAIDYDLCTQFRSTSSSSSVIDIRKTCVRVLRMR